MRGVGFDQLEIDRLERALDRRPRLADRFFTEGEREYARSMARPGQHLAVRFCAKEAAAKALGLESWSWRDIEVAGGGADARVRLHGPAARVARDAGAAHVLLSMSHTQKTAGAVVIVA